MTEIILEQTKDYKIVVESESLRKANHGQSGRTLLELITADPVETGYTKEYIENIRKSMPDLSEPEIRGLEEAKIKAKGG